MDDYLRAFDVETGAELWQGRLPAGGQALPMTYRLRPDGKQFVVIAAGGHGQLGARLGDAPGAFAPAVGVGGRPPPRQEHLLDEAHRERPWGARPRERCAVRRATRPRARTTVDAAGGQARPEALAPWGLILQPVSSGTLRRRRTSWGDVPTCVRPCP